MRWNLLDLEMREWENSLPDGTLAECVASPGHDPVWVAELVWFGESWVVDGQL
jgi:hypothetical protein